MLLKSLLALGIAANTGLFFGHGRYSKSHINAVETREVKAALARRWEHDIRQLWQGDMPTNETTSYSRKECAPLRHPTHKQCAHVTKRCKRSDTFLSVNYVWKYFCASPAAQPFVFGALVILLVFLFSFIGITASDFFCPNLATIADVFGLDENVAGVTFLAFGNGSPDLFSTFAAMRSDAGSLAIGELLGAASFIVSVVAGSMCIVRPFRVNPIHFIRDVGFFTVAVGALILVLRDGSLQAWEAASLAGWYVVYVVTVIISTWWEKRRGGKIRLDEVARSEYTQDDIPEVTISVADEPYRDTPSSKPAPPSLLAPPSIPASPRQRSHSSPAFPSRPLSPNDERPGPTPTPGDSLRLNIPGQNSPPQAMTRSTSFLTHRPHPPPLQQLPSFSLLGALEFRSVVTSLQRESPSSTLNIFETPVSPMYAAGHYHSFGRKARSRRRRSSHLSDFDSDGGSDTHSISARSPSPLPTHERLTDFPFFSTPPRGLSPAPPSIIATSPTATGSHDQMIPDKQLHHGKVSRFRKVAHTLFPTLQNLGTKPALHIVASVLAAPAVLLLTITLPVIVTPRPDVDDVFEGQVADNGTRQGQLIQLEEGREDSMSVERMMQDAEDAVEDEFHDHPLEFNKYLTAVQLVCGPTFCVAVCFSALAYGPWLVLATAITGLSAAALVLIFANEGTGKSTRLALCLMGFVVSMVWIMAIADEVVQVLNTFGLIFGLSDAIIGLTIFAIGNSLADFVANFTVAAFAPIMGFSACFGGPMLNILMGIGLSGSLVIHQQGVPYPVEFSNTLLVSGIGLLFLLVSTLCFVPWNGFYLDRRWGIFLICAYLVIMVINILVEIFVKSRTD